MARTSSIFTTPLTGNLGNQTLKNYGGTQVAVSRFRTTSAKGEGASKAQRETRLLMPNLTLIGSQIKDWLPALWENNRLYKRPYTHFISLNLSRDLLVLPKQMIDAKLCIWGQLQISSGSLPTLSCTQTLEKGFSTDILCPHTSDIGSMSLGSFSQYVLDMNPRFRPMDFLVFVVAEYFDYSIAAPATPWYVTSFVGAIQLDPKATALVDYSFKGIRVPLVGRSQFGGSYVLAVDDTTDKSIACVHVRKERGTYLASSQVMSWNFYGIDDIALMKSSEYIDYCAASWGYKDKIL